MTESLEQAKLPAVTENRFVVSGGGGEALAAEEHKRMFKRNIRSLD